MNKAWGGIVPSRGRRFVKMQGLRNHFAIVDARQAPYRPTTAEIVRICDVQTGIGADQLLVVEPPSRAGAAAGALAFMRIINIDGRDAEACGNATRCVAWLLLEETGADDIILETLAGPLPCRRAAEKTVSVGMGGISTDWAAIPLAAPVDTMNLPVASGPLRNGVALNIGNPHAVFFVDDLDAVDMARHAHAIQNDPLFPQKVNVGAAQLVSEDRIRLSVYERPGILTAACGSGACVATRAARLLGLTRAAKVRVEMAAGSVEIEMLENNGAVMTGPVDFCFSGALSGLEGQCG